MRRRPVPVDVREAAFERFRQNGGRPVHVLDAGEDFHLTDGDAVSPRMTIRVPDGAQPIAPFAA